MPERKRMVLIGGGGHCMSVLDAALRMDYFDQIVITDPDISAGTQIMGCEVVGSDDILLKLYGDGIEYAFITVGSIKNTKKRREIWKNAEAIGFDFPNIIDPSAVISDSVQLGRGVFVGKNAVINAFARIEDMAIINSAAIIEHECMIKAFTHISVHAAVCGNSVIGADSFVGAGATVIQGLKIGDHVVIGAGSVILNDVDSNRIIYGPESKMQTEYKKQVYSGENV